MDSYLYGDQTYSVRHPKLDSQRSKLIKCILSIPENLEKGQLQQELFFIQKMCAAHFSFEEMEMNKDCYADFEEHSMAHRELYKNLSLLSRTFEDNIGAGRKLKRFLLEWFEKHTIEHDKRYLQFCQLKKIRGKNYSYTAS